MGRTRKSILNSSVGAVTQLLTLIITFMLQLVFVKTLGAQYLGANGLFSNLLSFISFAELGIGAAITAALYKPLAEKNQILLESLMNLYAKIYKFIGLVIIFLGVIATLIIPSLVKSGSSIPNIRLMFFLYVISSAVTYFYAYASQIYLADQKSYKVVLNQFVFRLIQVVFQIGTLIVFRNYVVYLLILIACNFLVNFKVHKDAVREYPFLKNTNIQQVDEEVLLKIKKNVLGTMTSKIGWILVFATDNILISKFLGLSVVGIFSNYSLVTQGLTGLVDRITGGVTGSIGNLSVTADYDNKIRVYKVYSIVVVFIGLFISTLFMVCIQDFIRFFFSSSYLLSKWTVLLIAINLGLNIIRQVNLTFCSAMGLFWNLKYKSITEAIVNFLCSLLLVKYTDLGLNGVLLGTMGSHLMVNLWWEPFIVFKYGLKGKTQLGILMSFKYNCLIIGGLILAFYFGLANPATDLISFLLKGVLSAIGIVAVFTMLHIKSDAFADIVKQIRSVLFKLAVIKD